MSEVVNSIIELIRAGRGADAELALRKAIVADPNNAALRRLAAELCGRARRHELSLEHAAHAASVAPDVGANHEAHGLALMQMRRRDEAAEALCRAVELDPSLATAHNGLGVLAILHCAFDDAEAHFVRAIEAKPNETAALCNFATMLKNTGRGDEAAALMGPALEALPDDVGVQWVGAVMSNYAAALTPEQIADQHRRFGAAVNKAVGWKPWLFTNDRDPNRMLRVGFLSPDLRRHSVAHFLLPLVESLDRERVAVACYSLATKPDAITDRFRSRAQGWRDVSGATDRAIVDLIRADGIDVLVDCAGLFEGARPAVLAIRAAPVQINWLGYPNTTGIDAVDVRLVDDLTDPAGSEPLTVETLERLGGCFVCFRPLDETPPPAAHDGPFTFGSFNVFSKLNDPLLDTWARLLRNVPESRLLLKTPVLDSADVRRWTGEEFDQRGVDPGRLDLVGFVERPTDHIEMYRRVGVALDPFPYNGTTTTCEALWMGVPVVTLRGRSHPGRVGASLLTAVGHPEWIGESTDEYVAIASRLASNRDCVSDLRARLRVDVAGSPLRDEPAHARRFESAIRSAWKRWCASPRSR